MRIISRLKRRKKLTIALLLIIGLLLGAYAFGFFDKKVEREQEKKTVYHSQLTGNEVEKDLADRPILGVMIENSSEARPQTGLDSAGIVFETVAEGGITRYLALFQEDMPAEVGPVRSIRAYFLDWAMGFDASIAHVGGSADALAAVDERNANSLNQFRYPEPYHRVSSRAAPHNMYASTEGLRELQKDRRHKKADFKEIPRSNDSPSAEPTATNIAINFSSANFQAEFRYDKATNSYTRYLAGKPHIDAETNQPITVKNVIVIKMPSAQINAEGEGEALVFKDGSVQTVSWELDDYKNRIKLIDSNDNEVSLNRGDSWFAVLPGGRTVTY